MEKKNKKSLFISATIRDLSHNEKVFHKRVKQVIKHTSKEHVIGYVPGLFSVDGKQRPLILKKEVVDKVEFKHGNINIYNLLINAHDWNIGIKNMDYISEKINLIKLIPNSDNFLIISAYRKNGYYILTHFETEVLRGNELKSLLGRGDSFSRDA